MTVETERVRRHYDEMAPRYDRTIRLAEKLLFDDGRRWVCSRASGDVLEIGIGTGRNLPYYPEGARLTGVDLSQEMLSIARGRAEELGREIDLLVADAQRLDCPDESFDTVVSTLFFCTVPDERSAISEARRVLRPGGKLLLLDHVRSPVRPVRWVQQLLEPLMTRFEDHLLRDPLDHLEAEGFMVEECERLKWGSVERVAARKR